MTDNIQSIFHTEGNGVNAMLNVALGVNLVAIDNKLYLVYCGALPLDETATTVATAPEATTAPEVTAAVTKNIVVSYPNGGEVIQVGEIATIGWTSELSVNEAVKIELYKDEEPNIVIVAKTSNSGSFEWDVPLSLEPGIKYKIKLTRLTASDNENEENYDFSDGNFIVSLVGTTTTTTTTESSVDLNLPDTSLCSGIPILELPEYEQITYIMKDEVKGGILFATSRGRVLRCSEALVNAYLTGDRKVYAEVADGFGNVSDTAWSEFFYALYNKIAEVNEDKEIVKYRYATSPSAIIVDRITATFLSSALLVKQDLGFWKQLIWTEQKPSDTDITICIRSANTIAQLREETWDNCFVSRDSDVSSTITRNLDNISTNGKYIQFKVIMTTDSKNVTPVVVNLSITYSTKLAVYFFTTKFSLRNNSDLKTGFLVADVTEPQNTEVQFGISSKNSGDWTDYDVVELDKFFSLNNLENIKVGIKFTSYGDNIPEVAEFSVMSGGEKLNLINQTSS